MLLLKPMPLGCVVRTQEIFDSPCPTRSHTVPAATSDVLRRISSRMCHSMYAGNQQLARIDAYRGRRRGRQIWMAVRRDLWIIRRCSTAEMHCRVRNSGAGRS